MRPGSGPARRITRSGSRAMRHWSSACCARRADEDESPSRIVGRYELLEEIGRGREGVVYRAIEGGIAPLVVAVKLLRAEGIDLAGRRRAVHPGGPGPGPDRAPAHRPLPRLGGGPRPALLRDALPERFEPGPAPEGPSRAARPARRGPPHDPDRGRRRAPARAAAGRHPPRPEAAQHPARRGGQAVRLRLRASPPPRRRLRRRQRRRVRDGPLHRARAVRPPVRRGRPGERRLQPRRDPLRDDRGPSPVSPLARVDPPDPGKRAASAVLASSPTSRTTSRGSA